MVRTPLDGHVWIDGANLMANGSLEARGRDRGAHDPEGIIAQKGDVLFRHLPQRQIDVGGRRDFEFLLFHFADDSHDFDRTRRAIGVVEKQALADWRTIAEELLRERSADERDGRTIAVVFLGEVAPVPQGNAHR